MKSVKDFFLTAGVPRFVKNEKKFYILNVFTGLCIFAFLYYYGDLFGEPVDRSTEIDKAYFYIESLWGLVILLVFSSMLVSKKFGKIGTFAMLIVFTFNRKVLLLVVFTIIYFPIEVVIFLKTSNYYEYGFEVSTLILEALASLYFIFIMIKFAYSHIIKERGNRCQY